MKVQVIIHERGHKTQLIYLVDFGQMHNVLNNKNNNNIFVVVGNWILL